MASEDAEMAEVPEAAEEAAEGAKEEPEEAEAKDADAEAKEEAEGPKEREQDATEDPRARLPAGAAALSASDTTLNAMLVAGGRLLTSLSQGGCQYLLAGARSTVGIKSGRYMFEARIIESLNPAEAQGTQGRSPQPRQLVRLGVSTAGSSLLLSDGPDGVCFDSEGYFIYERSRKRVAQKFARDQTVALLVNLDPKSPNANTVSIFRDGVRISEPQPLPEKLHGKVLYPTVTYKNVTLAVNFGPEPKVPLPFACRTLAEAAQEDAEVAPPAVPNGGQCQVMLPVGLPEQGFFDWVDDFLEKNPDYVELSDRKILEWASKSGLWRPRAAATGSNDKPDLKFGIPMMDDFSVRQVINAIAPTQSRNYIIPELKGNLLASERAETLKRFGAAEFKKTATVILGEPSTEYKERVQALVLADKTLKAEAERKKKHQEEERKRLLEEKRKKAEEARKAKEAAQKRKEGKEVKEEDKAEAPKEDEQKEDEKKELDEAPVELTEEEKALWHRKLDVPDLDEKTVAKAYASFSMPGAEEGFDAVTFAWQSEAASVEILKKWVLERKMTQKVEDLQPGAAFKEQWSAWTKSLQEWRRMQTDYKDPTKRKALLAKRKEEAKKRKAEAGDAGDGAEDKEEEGKASEINVDDLDVFAVEDVTDIGNGEPLFQHFVYEDWALLSIRYELHLLLHSFKKDLSDPDRPSFTEEHMPFYYNKYFKKSFSLKHFSVEEFKDFLDLIRDTATKDEAGPFLQAVCDEDTPLASFVKVTEDQRRERVRRIDAGDETAKLRFQRPPPPPRQGQAPANASSRPAAGGAARPAAGGSARPASGSAAARPASYGARPASYGHGSGGGGSRNGSGGGSYSASSGGQKRPYGSSSAPASSWSSAKYPRTTYSSGSSYGSGGGSYYRR